MPLFEKELRFATARDFAWWRKSRVVIPTGVAGVFLVDGVRTHVVIEE